MAADGRNAQLEQAQRLLTAGVFDQAAKVCTQALRQQPSDAAALRLLAAAQAAMGDFGGARGTLEKHLKLRPADVSLLADIARTYLNEGRVSEAVRAADRALRLSPGSTALIGLKAHILAIGGDPGQAWEVMRPAIEAGASDPGLATSLGQIAARIGQTGRAAEMIRRCLAGPSLPPLLRAELCFRLGDVLDAAGEWGPAFAAYEEGNRIRRGLFVYDVRTTVAAINELIDRWPARLELPASGSASDLPIFIVGMPRSGTSLVEQILGSHPAIHPGGELEDIQSLASAWQGSDRSEVPVFRRLEGLTGARLDAAARAYLDRLRRLNGRAARVTDKLPVNFLHLGLISRLFPGARAVHCTRDPLDTCVSCYFQNFSGPIHFAYNLAELGAFFRAYRRLMVHWDAVLEFPRLVVPYEAMVADAEAASRGLIAFAGLEWSDACLRFYESARVVLTSSNDQVRRPIYASSVGRWRRYEKHIGPLAEALAEA